ncbi:MAG TPA: SOS response-associated peptidase [Stellaceae bacterium]|jgi:putative SOS response-associated peptidase YedK
MCGRAHLSSDVEKLIEVFSIPPSHPAPNVAASWNVAPTDPLPVVRYNGKTGERSLDVLRWGLVPFWAKGIKVGFANINAKAEGIDTRPAFREAFQGRRCPVPVDDFYEWAKTASGKKSYAIALADRSIMALAGLWETWRSPAGELVRSFAIVTTVPNALCGEIHNRMPVIPKPAAWPLWLGQEPADPPQLKALLVPYPSEEMIAWPVSARVGNVKNNDRSLIELIALP